MKKYRSLFYREWKLSSKHYIIRFVLLLLFVILLGLVFSIVKSNGEADAEGEFSLNDLSLMLSYSFAAIAVAVASEDNGVFKSDIQTDWLLYSYTLPITAFEKAAVRYIVKILALITGMSIAILSAVGISSITGSPFSGSMILHFFLLLDFFLLYNTIEEALALRAKSTEGLKKWKVTAGSVAVGIVFVLPELLLAGKTDSLSDTESMSAIVTSLDSFTFLAVPLLIVLLAIGFILAWKNLERREDT